MEAFAAAAAAAPACVSSPVLEAFVAKVSEVESEFQRRISVLQDEFRQRISVLKTEFNVVNSTSDSGSCPEVIVPSTRTKEQWCVVGGAGGRRRRVLKARRRLEAPGVKTTNPFSMLEGTEESEAGERRKGADEPTLPQGNVIVLGDSQVRHLATSFCARDKERRTTVCLPGAGIGRVSAKIDTCLKENGKKPIVFLSAGGNDIGKVKSEELIGKFRLALNRIKTKGGIPVMCGVLPRRGVGAEWLSRAIAVNSRLAAHCKSNGWAFVDNWDLFYGKDALYARDGVHLSRQGVRVFAGTLESELSPLRSEVNPLPRFFR